MLKAHHEPHAHERVEDSVAPLLVQSADFRGLSRAHFVTRRHREQKLLQMVEADIDVRSSHEALLPMLMDGQVKCLVRLRCDNNLRVDDRH